jgi:hypothetical protein
MVLSPPAKVDAAEADEAAVATLHEPDVEVSTEAKFEWTEHQSDEALYQREVFAPSAVQ